MSGLPGHRSAKVDARLFKIKRNRCECVRIQAPYSPALLRPDNMTVSVQENSEQIRVPATVAEEAGFFRNPCVVTGKISGKPTREHHVMVKRQLTGVAFKLRSCTLASISRVACLIWDRLR